MGAALIWFGLTLKLTNAGLQGCPSNDLSNKSFFLNQSTRTKVTDLQIFDIIFKAQVTHLILKWSKILQANAGCLIKLFYIPKFPLCPVSALVKFTNDHATNPNSPPLIITQCTTRKLSLSLDPSQFPFHTFRHSGATSRPMGLGSLMRYGHISAPQTPYQNYCCPLAGLHRLVCPTPLAICIYFIFSVLDCIF